jgi:hypothetical protein
MNVDTVVDGVNFEDEVFVYLFVNKFDLGFSQGNVVLTLADVCNHFLAKVLVDQSGRTQLGHDLSFFYIFTFFGLYTTVPILVEGALMVIKSVLGNIKYASDIALDVELV